MTGEVGWIYTLHLAAPLGTTGRNHARHYTGWASDAGLLARLESHRSTYADAAIMRWCRFGGHVYRRRIVILEDWEEVTEP